MHGIPSCGKTVLSSTVIQNIYKYCESRTGSIVLYCYFDFNDIEKQKHGKMIRSLVTQSPSNDASHVLKTLSPYLTYADAVDGRYCNPLNIF